MKESNLSKLIAMAVSKLGITTLFRNNVGTGWQGASYRMPDGSMIISDPRPLHAGLCKGSSDLIGWTSVEVRPDMVGKKIAVFTAVEIKVPGAVGASDDQLNFMSRVKISGGIAGIARSPQEAIDLLNNGVQPKIF